MLAPGVEILIGDARYAATDLITDLLDRGIEPHLGTHPPMATLSLLLNPFT